MKRTELRELIRLELRFRGRRSNHAIAKKLGTTHKTVGRVRAENPNWAYAARMGLDRKLRRVPAGSRLTREILRTLTKLSAMLRRYRGRLAGLPYRYTDRDRALRTALKDRDAIRAEWEGVNKQMEELLSTGET